MADWINILWRYEPGKNVDKIYANGLTQDDVANAMLNYDSTDISRSSGRYMYFGRALDGRYIAVPYEIIDRDTIYPVAAFQVPEPRQ